VNKGNSNKLKIVNDPIYGFITIPYEIIFDIIEHPYYQRLRRIKQLGLTSLVYPGALHTRFQHAMGAMYLMGTAIEVLRSKGINISEEEAEGVTIAVLLHDIGHGPFSHALETSIVNGVHHEDISLLFMDELNKCFKGGLTTAIGIFKNEYPKKFLHQLVSSQLDMDRLDYLRRDSFFTGVSEGVISSERIIKMLMVVDDSLAIEAKGIYSIEKFLVARRLMYWQVYLHKTVLVAEFLLVHILRRAKEVIGKGSTLFATPALQFFLENKFSITDFRSNEKVLETFARLDDYDIYTSVKVWMDHSDKILAEMCTALIDRTLLKVEIQNGPFDPQKLEALKSKVKQEKGVSDSEADYYVFTGKVENSAYKSNDEKINILYKDGRLQDIAQASDQLNISALTKTVEKYFLCYPK
jgi:HD superfamily phosphohydrolase